MLLTLLVLNFGLDILDCVGRLDLEGDGLACATETEYVWLEQASGTRAEQGNVHRPKNLRSYKIKRP